MKDVKGKTVLITGAASGMGLSWAEHFAADGANLVLWDVQGEALERAAEPLRARGVDVMTQRVDVSDREAVYRAALKVQAETGGVDVLVNNAAVAYPRPLLEASDEEISATLDVDLKALFWTMKAFLPRMIEKGSGHVVNVASAAGFVGIPRITAYVASKWGVIGLTESVRYELETQGHSDIHFTLFCPSYVDTGMFEGAKPPRLSRMLKPEDAVKRAYDAFRNDEYFVLVPTLAKLAPLLKGLLPARAFDRVAGLFGIQGSLEAWRDVRR